MFNRFCLLMVFVTILSCRGNNSSDPMMDSYSKNYAIPDSLISHIPFSDFEYGELFQLKFATNAGKQNRKDDSRKQLIPRFIIYKYRYTNSFSQKLDSLRDQSQVNFSNQYSDYMVIATESQMKEKFTELEINSMLKNSKYVIPDFNLLADEQLSDGLFGLERNYEFYILKKGSKNVLVKRFHSENSFLPKRLRHGYSCGFALNKQEKVLLFWSIAW